MNLAEPSEAALNLAEPVTLADPAVPIPVTTAELTVMRDALRRAAKDVRRYVAGVSGGRGATPKRLAAMVGELEREREGYEELLGRVREELTARNAGRAAGGTFVERRRSSTRQPPVRRV